MPTVKQALVFSFAERYGAVIVGFGVTLVIARLLTPHEIGVFSLAASLAAIAHTFRDLGVASYLVQEKDLTTEKIRSATGVTLIGSWLIALALLLISNPLAHWYGEDALGNVISVTAINFLIIPINSPVRSLLRRNLQFDVIMKLSWISTLFHAGTSVTLAYYDFGSVSLAWGGVAGNAINATLLGFYRRQLKVPLLPSFRDLRPVVSFGGRYVLADIIQESSATFRELSVGKFLGFSSVGYLSRAHGLVQLFEGQILTALNQVILPHFSALRRENRDIVEPFIHWVSSLLGVAWPFFGMLLLAAEPIVLILYGDQWIASVSLLRVLAFGSLFYAHVPATLEVILSQGKIRIFLKIIFVTHLVLIILIFFSSQLSLKAVAMSYVVFSIVSGIIAARVIMDFLQIPIRLIASIVYRNVLLAGLCLLPVAIANSFEVISSRNFAFLLALSVIIWFVTAAIMGHPIANIIVRPFPRLSEFFRKRRA